MQKILFTLFLFYNSYSYAEDYSLGNTNPFVSYKYQNYDEQYNQDLYANNNSKENSNDINYISQSIPNPITYLKKHNEYKHLIVNSSKFNGCWDKAGQTYGVDPWLLMAVAKVESSFNPSAYNQNKNKSYDIGVMQINSTWLPTLNKYGITKESLLNPCTSIFVGAWIMAQNIKKFGFNKDGIGAYNCPSILTIRRRYADKVYTAYNKIIKDLHQ